MAQNNASWHDRIVVDPEILVGKPVIAGTRIPISLVLNLLAHGYDVNRILEAYPNLTRADIQAALSYDTASTTIAPSSVTTPQFP